VTLRAIELAKSAFRNTVGYAYRNARVQFHPALYVVLYAALYSTWCAAAFWAISSVTPLSISLNWEIVGVLAGPLAVGELVRGHVRLWLRSPLGKWSAIASAAGGAAAGLTLWAISVARWGVHSWSEPLACAAFGTASFLLIGWLIQYQARQAMESSQ
jgi:hypothetical protein